MGSHASRLGSPPGRVLSRSVQILSWILLALSLVVAVLGLVLIYQYGQPEGKNAEKTTVIVDNGIYGLIRHPMYFGFIIWIIGFPMFTNAAFTLASAIIWIPQILYWKISEERQLVKKYKDYAEYKKQTWF